MRYGWKRQMRRWLPGMLLLYLLFLSGCGGKERVVVIPADREVKLLPCGNYLVTPAWIRERLEAEIRCAEVMRLRER